MMISAAFAFNSCSEDATGFDPVDVTVDNSGVTRAMFAEDDGSKVLSAKPHINAKNIIRKVPKEYIAEMTDTLGRANITDEQYAEIQAFAQELTAGLSTNKAKYDACFKWIVSNIKYEHADNDPYPVFVNRVGVCQGYANLLFIMMHSLDIPAFVCNGILNPLGGHAWNYVYCDSKWYVSDPTNNGSWLIDAVSSYAHLLPSSFDVVLAKENGIWYNLSEYQLNICHVAEGEDEFVVPFSINGYQVTSFNPSMPIASNIRQINIGKNITTLGENYVGLEHYADNVEYIEVDPENTTFASYLGVVYRKAGGDFQLTHIPSAMKCVELMPMNTVYKNTIYNHAKVKEIYFPEGTKKISNFAIENCPKLERVYVPVGAEYSRNMLFQCPATVEIIEGEPSGIKHVTM